MNTLTSTPLAPLLNRLFEDAERAWPETNSPSMICRPRSGFG